LIGANCRQRGSRFRTRCHLREPWRIKIPKKFIFCGNIWCGALLITILPRFAGMLWFGTCRTVANQQEEQRNSFRLSSPLLTPLSSTGVDLNCRGGCRSIRPQYSPSSPAPVDTSKTQFVRLLSAHSSRLYGFILTLVLDRNLTDDIFQNVCVVLWEKFSTFEPDSNFLAWACRVAQYQVMAERRKHKRHPVLSTEVVNFLADEACARQETDSTREAALAICLEQLSKTDRTLIERRYFQQCPIATIAQSLNRSESSVYRAFTRIHTTLLTCIRRRLADA
jgi:RNA polymerase sigma-70 factor, ECF subfamily